MKKSSTQHPKKNRPADLQRITNEHGKRVWVTGGKQYASMADVINGVPLQK